ncbi:MAG TPA: DUF1572 family protein [Balneolales bacterium]|nr:DUF1572 family protein [Balneolales bacterium]
MVEFLMNELSTLYEDDLQKFVENLKEFPEDKLWLKPENIPNSAGVLAQHIAGNLNFYIGATLGETNYKRERDAEFTISDKTKKELIQDLESVIEVIRLVLPGLSEDRLKEPFPVKIPRSQTTLKALLHLYHHLSYHLGQLNYLKRIVINN